MALFVATLLVIAAVGEATLRIVAARAEREAAASRPVLPGGEALPDLVGVFALARKNALGIHKGVLIRTNANGLRGPDFAPVADPDVIRVVVAGDSFTFGSGVDEADVYASRLGALLDRDRPGQHHQVVNAGLAGAHIGSVVDRLERAIAAYQPGLYVYGFTLNDIEGPSYAVDDSDAQWRTALAWTARQPFLLVRYGAWKLLTVAGTQSPAEQSYPRELHRNYFENPEAWGRFTDGLDRFASLVRRDRVCGHVLIHTHLTDLDSEHPFHPFYDRVAEAARARGLGVTQSFPAFAGRDPGSLWINALDSHPNAEGHGLLAEALATDLASLPEACWLAAAEASAAAGGAGPAASGR